MSSLSSIRPQITAVPLQEALETVGTWKIQPGPIGPEVAASLPVIGVTVSTDDIEPGWIFVGVPGARRHGASLAELAIEGGATVLVTDQQGAELTGELPIPTVVVDNPRQAAGAIASRIYSTEEQGLKVVGVTGTNGKTTTTYLLRSTLSPLLGKLGILGTIEVDTGGFSTFAERTTHEAPVLHRALASTAESGLKGAVVEVSSHALSLDRVHGITFDLAVFTNLQHDHLDFYENSMDLYFEAKASLFAPERTKQGVTGVDDEYGRRLARTAKIPMQAVQVLTDDEVDLPVPLWKVVDIRPDASFGGTHFILVDPEGTRHEVACPIPGHVNVQDAALAVVGAVALGVPIDDAIRALREAPSVPGRMEWIKSTPTQPTVMVDYAHTPEAIESLLRDLRPLTKRHLVAVFGTDGDRDATKRIPLAEIVARGADVLWVTDENPRTEDAQSIRDTLLEGISRVRPDGHDVVEIKTCRRDAVREAILCSDPDDLVVIFGKGAERYQEVRGIRHHYMDSETAFEVLRDSRVR